MDPKQREVIEELEPLDGERRLSTPDDWNDDRKKMEAVAACDAAYFVERANAILSTAEDHFRAMAKRNGSDAASEDAQITGRGLASVLAFTVVNARSMLRKLIADDAEAEILIGSLQRLKDIEISDVTIGGASSVVARGLSPEDPE